jgi:hypothetical protein
MTRRPLVLLVASLVLAAAAACESNVNLTEALEVTGVLSGYYDNGVNAEGKNHLLPSITFSLKNKSAQPVANVDLDVAFWQEGADGENDSVFARAIGSKAVQPGAVSEPMTVRAPHGYTLQQPRAELFVNSDFKDFIVKIFAKRGGRIFPLGQFKLDRQIIPHQTQRAPAIP